MAQAHHNVSDGTLLQCEIVQDLPATRSATALKASEVVVARAMQGQYIPIWEYVKRYFYWAQTWSGLAFVPERVSGCGLRDRLWGSG